MPRAREDQCVVVRSAKVTVRKRAMVDSSPIRRASVSVSARTCVANDVTSACSLEKVSAPADGICAANDFTCRRPKPSQHETTYTVYSLQYTVYSIQYTVYSKRLLYSCLQTGKLLSAFAVTKTSDQQLPVTPSVTPLWPPSVTPCDSL
eukprot:448410-Pyramimonas_sp.AAC.1